MAANLAAKGFVALAYDPVGLGERMQAYDRRVGGGSRDAAQTSTFRQALKVCSSVKVWHGTSSGMLFARSTIWSDRPMWIPTRVGAAGCSGGGCITTYIAALDKRVKAAAPACFINSLRVLFKGSVSGFRDEPA